MMDIDQVTSIAQQLNIKLTAAEDGTDLYRCWADRVEGAAPLELVQELLVEPARGACSRASCSKGSPLRVASPSPANIEAT